MILPAGAAAYSNSANHFPIALECHSAGEDHDAAIIGRMDAKELLTSLRMRGQVFRGDIERAGSKCLLNRNIDAANPGSVHSYMSD